MKWNAALLFLMLLIIIGCSERGDNSSSEFAFKGEEVTAVQQKTGVASLQAGEILFDQVSVQNDYAGKTLEILDISERNLEGRSALAVTFSVPLNPAKDHSGYFNVSLSGEGVVDGGWLISASGKMAWFPHMEPNSNYEVTLLPGLEAGNGSKLVTKASGVIQTRHLQASVNFDTSGAFLTADLGGGLPVVTVNIDEVDIDFHRIEESKLNKFLRQADNLQGYSWSAQRAAEFGELVYSGRYSLAAPKNARVKRSIHIQDVEALKTPGVYLAAMRQAGRYEKVNLVWFAVTDLGLHARQYEQQLDIHVASLKTGKSLGGVSVRLLNKSAGLIHESLSSPEGLASFDSNGNDVALIVAQQGDNFSLIQTRKPALDLSSFDLGRRPQLPNELFVYTPRDLFRPGEVIDFNALLRDGDGRSSQATVLNAEIKRPDGSVIKSFKWQTQELAYYHYAWKIPNDVPLGDWRLTVKGALKNPVDYSFKVEEFLPERMKLSFNNNAVVPLQGLPEETLKIPVLGEYLYGAPAAGNRLSTQVSVRPWRNPIESLKDYEFGFLSDTSKQEFELADTSLDEKGEALLEVSSRWALTDSPLRVKLISSLYESGGRPVTRTYSSLIWPSNTALGIRSSFGEDNAEANSRVSFDVVRATIDGDLKAAQDIEVNLIREDRQYFWVYDDNRGWHYQWSDKEFVEVSETINIAEGKSGRVEFPVTYGGYRLEVMDRANNIKSSLRFYAGYNWYSNWQDSQTGKQAPRPDAIAVTLDKEHYQVGDIAKVSIIPPEAGEALIMVEGDSPLWMSRLTVPAEGIVVDILVADDWQQHNLYVTAMLVQPADQKQAITPKRSFGLAHLALDRSQRNIPISFDVPEKTLPGKTFNVKINIDDSAATLNKKTWVTLAAVDVGVLSISNFKTPNPNEAFFGQRRYNVESRDIYNSIIELNQAARARLRFGGDADLQRGGKEPQSEVQIVSLFNQPVAVEQGEVIIPIELPDFNGRIRLMVVAFTDDSFGHAEQEVTVAAPVVTQLAMPRFMAQGDESTLALDINNLSGEKQTLEVSLSGSGAIKLAGQLKTLVLDDKQKQTLIYPITAHDHKGQATFNLQVSGEAIDDLDRQWQLGVRPAYPAIVSGKQVILDKGDVFELGSSDVAGLLPDTIEAQLSISSQANLNLQDQLKNLLAYPYGCLEQTSSRAYPLGYATKTNQERFSLSPIDDAKRIDMIAQGIDRIATMQLKNGGFGLWSNRSPEEHWLTAYVTDFLLTAREQGVAVPNTLIDSSIKRLKSYLNRSGRFVGERWSQNSNHYNLAYKAYAGYVLSRVNQAPLGSLRNLYDHQLSWAQSGLPQVHLGLALLKMGDEKRGLDAIDKGLNNLPETRQYLGDYGSGIRDMAMAIHLLIDNDVRKKQAFHLSFELADRIKRNRWLSTQERNALFLAGISLGENNNEPWLASLMLEAPNAETLNQSGLYQTLLDGTALTSGVELQSKFDNPLFVSAIISGYGKQAPEPVTKGLNITRTWYNTKGEMINSKQASVGELYIVHLELRTDERTPDALVVDLLPAGFELENQNLDHAIKLDDFTIDNQSYSQLTRHTEIKHQEYRDDRFVAALDLNNYNPANIFYLMRAVTPGSYQVPPPLVEDMYRPARYGIGETPSRIDVVNHVPLN